MTEDGAALRRRQDDGKPWSKYKWRGKIFSNNEEAPAEEKGRPFALDDDVVDFLKPSTNKSRAPRIDVGTARSWPDAADVNGTSPDTHASSLIPARTSPRKARRLNLRVGFVRTNPEIIGEGGDQAELPAIAVSAGRRQPSRPQLNAHRDSQDDSAIGLQSTDDLARSKENPFDAVGSSFRPTPIKRAQTSFGEISPPKQTSWEQTHQASSHSTSRHEPEFRPRPLKRAPTGWDGVHADHGGPGMEEEENVQPGRFVSHAQVARTGIPPMQTCRQTEMDAGLGLSPVKTKRESGTFLPTESAHPGSFAAKIQRSMRAEEGRALHQAARRSSHALSDDGARPSTDAPRPSTSSSVFYVAPSPQPDIRNSLASLDISPESRTPSYSRSPHLERAPPPRPSQSPSSSHPFPIAHRSAAPPRKSIPSPSPGRYPEYDSSNNSSLRPTPSPGAPTPGSPNYFGLPSGGFEQHPRSPASHLDPESAAWAEPTSPPRAPNSLSGEAAMDDFAERVIRMMSIFRLTAEVEKPVAAYTPMQWLRASTWWFLKGRAGLEVIIRNQPRGSDGRPSSRQREQLLSQPHVDLAKAWWILSEVLRTHPAIRAYDASSGRSQAATARDAGDYETAEILDVSDHIMANLRVLALSMSRNHVMPPQQSPIQGQDQSIWVSYPNFTPDVRSILSGQTSRSLTISDNARTSNTLSVMPLTDGKNCFCYGRMFVQMSLATDDQETDRVSLPCVLSILRDHNDWQLKVMLCSQSELVNMCISGDRNLGPTWQEVQWRTRQHGLYVQLPRAFTLNVDLSESDYKQLRGIYDYTRNIEASLHPKDGELLVYEATLKDFQYSNRANPKAFPAERVKRCRVRVFEQSISHTQGGGQRRCHRGYRLLIVTSPRSKTLNNISEIIGLQRPLDISLATDPNSDGSPAMLINIQADKARSTLALTFDNQDERNALYCALISIQPGPDEQMPAQLPLKAMSIEQVNHAESLPQSANNALARLQWKDVQVINSTSDNLATGQARTELSAHLRAVARCSSGSVTDRMNLGPGELRLRLDTSGSASLQILRAPQEDMTMSVDSRRTEPDIPDALAELLRTIMSATTIRTYSFHSLKDLHAFQSAITGFTVKFDGVAATFAIARRRMVVPIYKRWEAQNVRIQIVQQDNIVQLLAFFEDFSHAESMSIQLKSMDVFEKADRGGKFGVRLVDAKFALPREEKGRERGEAGKNVEGRFVCLDVPEYPGEHDDVTVVFEGEGDRDRFLGALPAAPQVSRMINFKRKI